MTPVVNSNGPIIVVDDDSDFLDLFQAAFARSNVTNEIIPFSSGPDCLEYLSQVTSGQAIMPSHIFIDVNMCGMDGFETLKKIKDQSFLTKQFLITMLSSSEDERDIAKASQLGADFYQIKPFAFKDYISFANSLLA